MTAKEMSARMLENQKGGIVTKSNLIEAGYEDFIGKIHGNEAGTNKNSGTKDKEERLH